MTITKKRNILKIIFRISETRLILAFVGGPSKRVSILRPLRGRKRRFVPRTRFLSFKPFGRLLAPRRGLCGEMRGRVIPHPRFFCFFPRILSPDFEVS